MLLMTSGLFSCYWIPSPASVHTFLLVAAGSFHTNSNYFVAKKIDLLEFFLLICCGIAVYYLEGNIFPNDRDLVIKCQSFSLFRTFPLSARFY